MRGAMQRWRAWAREPEPRMTLEQIQAQEREREATRPQRPPWLRGLLLVAYVGVVVGTWRAFDAWGPAMVAASAFGFLVTIGEWGFERRGRGRASRGS